MNVFDINPPPAATCILDAATHTGTWWAIQIVADTQFNTLTVSNWDGNSPVNLTAKAGQIFYGAFTQIKLTSGQVVAYKA